MLPDPTEYRQATAAGEHEFFHLPDAFAPVSEKGSANIICVISLAIPFSRTILVPKW